jgi:predicted ATPase/transcriptional regulator with XRE-family HTH domain
METPASFGYWVRRRRKVLELTQAALAQRVGCAVVTIKKIEQDERRPSRHIAELLADQLAISEAERHTFIRMARGEFVAEMTSQGSAIQPSVFGEAVDELSNWEKIHFVARERELAQLEAHLAAMLTGNGRIVFIIGEAGRGKTTLMSEFARRVQVSHPDLIVASGNCNAYAGAGDPYLPFRDVMDMLTGDVEVKWMAGTISQEQTRRLWALLPYTIQALTEHGPDLLDVVVPGAALVRRAMVHTPGGANWQARLQAIIDQQRARPGNLEQRQLFEQYTQVLRMLAARHPLLLLLDDLQWADSASINLLFHLGRRLSGCRILILGAYRPSEVALGRGGDPTEQGEHHPLEPVVHEFKRRFGDIEIDLGRFAPEEGRAFVDALIESEPNRLGEAFREALFRHTEGHPLFTVELLRNMQERGDLVQDEAGRWMEGPAVDWDMLPVRIEAVIAQRIDRLPATLQEALKVASVEGETFTAEVVARVQAVDERQMVRQLSSVVDKQHRLVSSQGRQRLGTQQLSQYRFRHILFQKYLYDNLDEAERCYLHEAVGNALEQLYGEQTEEVATQLAQHFQLAGLEGKAIEYLHQAGERAVRLSANEEAINLLTRGLALLKTLPKSVEWDEGELMLQIALGVPLVARKGYAAPEVIDVYSRARALCQRLGKPSSPAVLRALAIASIVRSKLQQAHELGDQLLSLAGHDQNAMLLVEAHYVLGVTLFWMGEFIPARVHLEQALAHYDPRQQRAHIALYAQDPRVICLARLAYALWYLGYPDQAVQRSQEGLALAQELSHPFSLGYALNFATWLANERRDTQATHELVEAAITLAAEQGFPQWSLMGRILQGWVLVEQGKVEAGIIQMRQGMAAYRDTGMQLGWPYYLALLAQAYRKRGEVTQGLMALTEALSTMDQSGERWYEAELYRLKGEMLLKDEGRRLKDEEGDTSTEGCFRQAIAVARRQGAKSLELRAVMSLSRLWQQQGKKEEARQLLSEIYNWFTEGFDTVDLQEAKALLEELA